MHLSTACVAKVNKEVAKDDDIIDAIPTKRVQSNPRSTVKSTRTNYLSISTSIPFVLLTAVGQFVTVSDPDIKESISLTAYSKLFPQATFRLRVLL